MREAATRHELSFDKLSPRNFERMCLWLVQREGFEQVEHLGAAGKDSGRDLVARKGGRGFAFQCKRVRSFGPADARKELEKLSKHSSDDRPHEFVFIVACDVSDETRRSARRLWGDSATCHFWAGTELDARVKGHQDIISEFFASPPILNALHQLPAPSADFTGRESELATLLEASENGATITGMRGMGGIGKTALALVFSSRLSERYPDAQLYVNLRGAHKQEHLSPAEALGRVIQSFDPTARLPEDEEQLGNLYRSVLHDKRALLLMDNARDADQVEPLIPPPGCFLLVTSRQSFSLPGYQSLNLDQLAPDESCALLLKIAPRIGDEAEHIAKLCGYLPLALELAARALVEREDLSSDAYANRLEEETERRRQLVDASIELSYQLLGEENDGETLQQRWRLLAVFSETFNVAAAAAVWNTDIESASKTLGTLLRFSLLQWNPDVSRYRLHDLVRLVADARLDEAEREHGQRHHAEHYGKRFAVADGLYWKGGESVLRGLAQFDLEEPNIKAGHEWAVAHAAQDETATRLCATYPNAGAHLIDLRFHPEEQIRWLEHALAAARQLGNQNSEAASLGNMGVAYRALGDAGTAIEFYEKALEIARTLGQRPSEAAGLGNMGNAYAALGEYRKAINSHERALHIYLEIGDRRGEGSALGSLGLAYYELGEARKAIELHEQRLAIARETGDRRAESHALGNIGLAYVDLREPRRAVEYLEQDLVVAREISDRRGEGQALGNLGLAYKDLGEYRKTIEFHLRALDIDREIGDRRGEGQDLGNLGNACAALGEYPKAIGFYEHQLVIASKLGDRRGEANALFNTALSLDKLGKREDAIPIMRTAFGIYQQTESPTANDAARLLDSWSPNT